MSGAEGEDAIDPAYYCTNRSEHWSVDRTAMQQVRIVNRVLHGVCMHESGVDYVHNRSDRAVRVVVRVDTTLDNGAHSYFDCYHVPAKSEVEAGCVIPGPTLQRFDKKIVAASFS